MYKKIILLLLTVSSFLMVGCAVESDPSHFDEKKFSTQCLDGVVYYISREDVRTRGFGYMSVKYDRDGTVETC